MNGRTRIRPGSDEHRKELQEILIALLINALFLGMIALLLWPLGQASAALALAKGYGVLWLLLVASILVLLLIEQLTRLNADDHFTTYVSINLAVSVVLTAGWAAFAALTVGRAAADASAFTAGSLYVVGFLSCYLAFAVATSFYMGSIYKVVTLPLGLVGFIVFAVWPSLGRMLFGWFFALFGMTGF